MPLGRARVALCWSYGVLPLLQQLPLLPLCSHGNPSSTASCRACMRHPTTSHVHALLAPFLHLWSRKAPTKRFGILVQQDLAEPMQDILKTCVCSWLSAAYTPATRAAAGVLPRPGAHLGAMRLYAL